MIPVGVHQCVARKGRKCSIVAFNSSLNAFSFLLSRRWFHPLSSSDWQGGCIVWFCISAFPALGEPFSSDHILTEKALQRTSLRSSICCLGYTLRRRGWRAGRMKGVGASISCPSCSHEGTSQKNSRITRQRMGVYETYSYPPIY